jgi:hypothetical protein
VTATLIADPRPRTRRRSDTEYRLAHDVDVWVATASADGVPYVVPLSFDWDGDSLILATPADSPTGRNLADTGAVRLALGSTRDVTMIDGDADVPRTLPRPTASTASPRAASRRGARSTTCTDAS